MMLLQQGAASRVLQTLALQLPQSSLSWGGCRQNLFEILHFRCFIIYFRCKGRQGFLAASKLEVVLLSNGCNLYEGVLYCNTHCLHRHTLWRDADQLRLNVDQAGLHIDATGLYLEYLGQNGYEIGLYANAANLVPHQARRKADEVCLNSHACTNLKNETLQRAMMLR